MTSNSPSDPGAAPAPRAEQAKALRLWVVLSRAREAIASRLQEDVTRHGLTLTEFGILEVLYHKGPMLLGEVQRRILVSSGGVTYLVDRLESKGLVERRTCSEDRRARYAALTDRGFELISRIFPEHAACIEAMMSELTVDEQAIAHGLLRRLGLAAARADCGGEGSPEV
ncbi:MAG: MarR family transcriptional regulator [Gemmatimonas sp.]|nr:MarR family transcriptional regulator [Gemmatimonas sp.]